jgi:hypothetical protein
MERRMMALLLPWCDAAAFDGCSGRGLSGLRDDCQPLGDYFDDIPPDLSGQILFVVGQRTIPEDDDYNDLERALGAPDDRANVRLRGPVGPCVAQQYTTPRLSAIWARERIGAVVGAPVLQRCQAEGLAPVAKTFLEGGFRGGPREVGAGIAVIRKAVDAGIRDGYLQVTCFLDGDVADDRVRECSATARALRFTAYAIAPRVRWATTIQFDDGVLIGEGVHVAIWQDAPIRLNREQSALAARFPKAP